MPVTSTSPMTGPAREDQTSEINMSRGYTWLTQLQRHTSLAPDETVLRFEGRSLSWAEPHRRCGALAAALGERGIGAGDRVAILAVHLVAALPRNASGKVLKVQLRDQLAGG